MGGLTEASGRQIRGGGEPFCNLILKKGEPFCIFYRRNKGMEKEKKKKKYFLIESGKDLDSFKEEVWDLIVNNDKVIVKQHHILNKRSALYEVRVG